LDFYVQQIIFAIILEQVALDSSLPFLRSRRATRFPTTLGLMDAHKVIDGLIMYIGLVVLLTFHEFGHAWTALKCGDDTAKLQGRVSLNPLTHIDPIGTVVIPLLAIFIAAKSKTRVQVCQIVNQFA
jgi:hypothetical protein